MIRNDQGIDAWVEALAGRGARETPNDPEIAAIRAVLRAADTPVGQTSSTGEITEAPRLNALLQRLRREGLLEDAPADARPPRLPDQPGKQRPTGRPRPSWIGWTGGLAVAATLVLALLIPTFIGGPAYPVLVPDQSDHFDEAPRLRSAPGDQDRRGTDPAQIARLIQRLRVLHLPYRLHETEGTWRLDFYVPDNARAGASDWLSTESIPIPPTGWVRLKTPTPPR